VADKNTFFLVIEGIDGTGKSTVTRTLVQILQSTLGKNVKLTFEPHDPSCAGLFIRQILMRKLHDVPIRTLGLAFAVNRADHCDREISPFFQQLNGSPRVVVCDRYYLSSLVYQSDADITFNDVMMLNSSALKPDLTLFLNASTKTCYERMRNRKESKELFETNLNTTKAKYAEAIEFLKSRGEKVIEVQAEGSLSDVVSNVVNTLAENSPNWLTVQQSLKMDDAQHVFEPTSITIQNAVGNFSDYRDKGPLYHSDQLSDILNQLKAEVSDFVNSLPFNDTATLFLDIIRQSGYVVGERLPWTDLDAFELQHKLPSDVLKRGSALLLGESQRYDIVIGKLSGSQKVTTLRGISDFLFIFDSNPAHLVRDYYEREIINFGEESSISPSLVVIGRKQIANAIFKKALEMFREEYHYTLSNLNSLKQAFATFLSDNDS
jgi:dTMP kinase